MRASHPYRIEHSQNFLHDRSLVQRLVVASSVSPDDLVIEIGPGHGVITRALLERCGHVLAIEKDPRLVRQLVRRFGQSPRLTLFAGDILNFPLPHSRYKVFASIPYAATAAIVGKLTSGIAPPDDAYLVMQREAAQRFVGNPVTTLVSAQLAPWFARSIVHMFRRGDFRPAPAVDSVLLRIERRGTPMVAPERRTQYEDVVTAIFTAWQPTVRAAIRSRFPSAVWPILEHATADHLFQKPSQVPPEAWIGLFDAVVQSDDDRIWSAVSGSVAKLADEQSRLQKRTRTTRRR
jgi:23S rRNA (adenine-N6)-dimethyltransferase